MAKIYQQAKDKNVAKVLIYPGDSRSTSGKTSAYACKDADGLIRMTGDELKDAFVKGALIVVPFNEDGYDYQVPTTCRVDSTNGVTYLYTTTTGNNFTLCSAEGAL